MAPPLFSTLSAVTELFVTIAVFWFLYHAWRADHRWGIITIAILYETLFNITYMVYRVLDHDEASHGHPGWVTGIVVFHGTLSLIMFLGLIALVLWARRRVAQGEAAPIRRRAGWTRIFIAAWIVSILSGELLYLLYWTDVLAT